MKLIELILSLTGMDLNPGNVHPAALLILTDDGIHKTLGISIRTYNISDIARAKARITLILTTARKEIAEAGYTTLSYLYWVRVASYVESVTNVLTRSTSIACFVMLLLAARRNFMTMYDVDIAVNDAVVCDINIYFWGLKRLEDQRRLDIASPMNFFSIEFVDEIVSALLCKAEERAGLLRGYVLGETSIPEHIRELTGRTVQRMPVEEVHQQEGNLRTLCQRLAQRQGPRLTLHDQ